MPWCTIATTIFSLDFSATNDRGTLIDNVYFNKALHNVTVEVSIIVITTQYTAVCHFKMLIAS